MTTDPRTERSPEPAADHGGSCGDGQSTSRKPGRPRSTRTHVAILDATLDQLIECGYQGMSMEAIAERAGTSKATIYRWWSSKEELLVEALETRRPPPSFEPSGAPRRDLEDLLTLMIERLPSPAQSTIARLVGAMADSAELAAMLRGPQGGRQRRQMMTDLLRAAVERGELQPDLDVELACDQLAGPIMYRHLVTGGPLDGGLGHRLVADLWAAHGTGAQRAEDPRPSDGPAPADRSAPRPIDKDPR